MNTNHIKKYAPLARRDFITAVGKRLNQFGVYSKGHTLTISEPSFSGSVMQIDGNSFDATLLPARKRLVFRAEQLGFEALVEHVAYTWFNRLCALRFMELKADYLEHGFRVLSHPEKANSFEILDHAQDAAESLGLDRQYIVELKLAGNKDEELYRHLLLGQCHQLHKAMPFLFEALDDETELLLPDNLIRTDSILRGLVDDIPEQDWQQVEIIGWLYQFYISEKKDQVIGKVVKSEDIPAATQLFTPNWIVKYLVQNSVGRQWMMTYPDSSLKSQMEYYITPAEQEPSVGVALAAITPTSIEPETIKVIDPACGSGHILVEAYNLLKAIYEERGYRSRDIPKLILENNLYGLDIDDRAAQLAGFALMMKAREDDRRIFTRDIKLNVLALQSSKDLDVPYLWRRLDVNNVLSLGTNESLFDDDQSDLVDVVNDADFKTLQSVIDLFEHAKTFGSLIQVPADQADFLKDLNKQLQTLIEQGNSFQKPAAKTLLPFVQQAWYLAQQYDSVIANPPYLAAKSFNKVLKDWMIISYKGVDKDLFSAFILRNLSLTKNNGYCGVMTSFVWMFISTFENLRHSVLSNSTIQSLVQLHYDAFAEAKAHIMTCVLSKGAIDNYIGSYIRLTEFPGVDVQAPMTIYAIKNRNCGWFYDTQQKNFYDIPATPISYWASNNVKKCFELGERLGDLIPVKKGMDTGNNDIFLRLWHEVNYIKLGIRYESTKQFVDDNKKWLPYDKGGNYRKWYGNNEYVLNWENNGSELRRSSANLRSENLYFKKSITWCALTSTSTSARLSNAGSTFDSAGSSMFPSQKEFNIFLGLMNSAVVDSILKILNPTLNYGAGSISNLPFINKSILAIVDPYVDDLVSIFKEDWDSFETSYEFYKNPLITHTKGELKLRVGLLSYFSETKNKVAIASNLEEKCDQIFIKAYGLDQEMAPSKVPVSLLINPYFRYGKKKNIEYELLFREDIFKELISYSVGCMMGRYRLDKPGLIYAHSGNIDFDKIYNDTLEAVVNPFIADDDGIIPLTDQDWFKDDATNRFRDFVRTVWGEDNLQENLAFVAESLCLSGLTAKRGEQNLETIRRYLSNQFYKDHLKTYKKRPIYWLFSSGKQKAFEGLVYLHRYNDSTLPRMRTEYVTPLLGKYDAFADQLKKQLEDATTSEATLLNKELLALEKKQTELRAFDDNLKHYADRRIKLDLDDGVKVNYGKFGDLLAEVKAITGGKGE
ncbi:MAG: BREX-1 system adenine-specific DNA-methyltransferase PglX [Methylococcaceae bacterium]